MSETTPPSAHPSGLAPDEKLCPYCAETIKAAAVKCRFCQSDLGPALVGPAESTESTEPTEATEATEGTVVHADPGPRPSEPVLTTGRRGSGLIAGLVVLCLVLGGGLTVLVHRAQNPHLGTAPNGQVTDASFRNAAMSAASDAASRILSYSYQSFATDRKKGRALVTGEAAKEYDKAMDDVATKVATTRLTLKASVLSVGTISVEEHHAKVLVFVDTSTTREGSKQQQFQQSRLVMDLTRKDGDCTVSNMDAF
jgi:Mce-associated membrane protein